MNKTLFLIAVFFVAACGAKEPAFEQDFCERFVRDVFLPAQNLAISSSGYVKEDNRIRAMVEYTIDNENKKLQDVAICEFDYAAGTKRAAQSIIQFGSFISPTQLNFINQRILKLMEMPAEASPAASAVPADTTVAPKTDEQEKRPAAMPQGAESKPAKN